MYAYCNSVMITIIFYAGVLGEESGNNLEVILYWELASLFRKGSLIDKLINEDKGDFMH